MLPKVNRLSGNKNFERVRKQGFVVQGKVFGLGVYNRKDNNPSRFGFVVSTKISKRAVDRNRVKRTLRNALVPLLPGFKDGYDLIFLTKQAILNEDVSVVAEEIEMAARKGKVI